jgi:HEPN domain-containing protein
VKKAESDHRVAVGIDSGSVVSAANQICFLCQHDAEKYIKVLLEEIGHSIPMTHNLLVLFGRVQSHYPNIVAFRRGLSILNRYAVAPRYPPFSATKPQAASALRWSEKVREVCRTLLGLPILRSRMAL